MKNHLKTLAAPRTWSLRRKEKKYIVRPKPGSHPMSLGLSLTMVLRDVLKVASTVGEVKKLLNNNEVLVDGKRRKSYRYIAGLFDVVSYGEKAYRVSLDKKGKLCLVELSGDESKLKPCKVIGKTMLKGGKIQLNLHDGKNVLTDKKVFVGDTVVLQLPSLEIKSVLSPQKGSKIFLFKGKHSGELGSLKEIKDGRVVYEGDGQEVATAKDYLFVVGEGKQEIKVN